MRTRRQRYEESLQEFETRTDRLIRLAYTEAPEDFRKRFAVQTFIDGVGDCELQHVLRMARHRNRSEALVHTVEFSIPIGVGEDRLRERGSLPATVFYQVNFYFHVP